MINVALIANELRYTCGVTNHLLHLSKGLVDSGKVKLWIICGSGNGIERFNKIDVKVIEDKRFLHKERSLTDYFSAITYLNQFILKNKISVIHSHTHYAANIAANASKLSKAITVQTNHGLLQNKGRLKHFNAHHYIAINAHIRQYLITNKLAKEENLSYIVCGIPVDDSITVKNSGTLNIIAASRLNYEKGLDVFINAVSALNDEDKTNSSFTIAGEGELENSLKELNAKTKAGIDFPGNITDIYPLLRKSHIFVYPSRSKSEGFPAIITEAGACNALVISSKFNGVDSVLNNDNALFFNIEDINGLTSALRNAINNFEGYKGHSENLYHKIRAEYNIDIMIEKHLALYGKLND